MSNTINKSPAGFPCVSVDFRAQGEILGRLGRIKLLDILAFIVPVSQFIELDIVGRLFMSEVLLLGVFPVLLYSRIKIINKRLPWVYIVLTLLWLFGQVATDVIRETVFSDYVRGWAKIVFTLINFCALYLMLYNNKNRLLLFVIGLAVGGILKYFINPGIYAEGMPWKFGYGESITWLIILLAAMLVGRGIYGSRIACVLLASAGFVNIYMGYRSLAGICFSSSAYMVAQIYWEKHTNGVQQLKRQALKIGVVFAIVGIGIFKLYEYSASSGLLGENALRTYESQSSGKYGLFVGGRSEILISGRAILDSPFIGHGSWAKNYEYSSLFNELRRQFGYASSPEDEEGLIATHSHLLGAWVEAGFLGAMFWMWILSLPLRVLFSHHGRVDCLTPLLAVITFFLIWDILFSPYGAERRFVTPFYVVFLMNHIGMYRERVLV